MRHGTGGELGFKDTADGIDLCHIEIAKKEIVLQELERTFEGHFSDRRTPGGTGTHRDQPLDFKGLDRPARRALADAEQLLQRSFLRELVARYQPPLGDPALDLLDDHVAAFLSTEIACRRAHLAYLS